MLDPEQLKQAIEGGIPGAVAEVEDTRGTGDHFDAVVTSETFRGLGLVDQHRMVHRAMGELLQSDELHAFHLTTKVPS